MKKFIVIYHLILLFPTLLFPLEEVITLGKEDNWKDLSILDQTTIVEGHGGYRDIVLSDGEYEENADTDLLLHFNSPADLFTLADYSLVESSLVYSEEYRQLGNAAAAFQFSQDGIVFSAGDRTIFSEFYSQNGFSIEFRLYPARLSEGEIIFLWEGAVNENGKVISQKIECSVSERKLIWTLENFFRSPDGNFLSLQVTGDKRLLPRQWNHHLLRYDPADGLLEYVLNGSPEAVTYSTPSGHEASVVFTPAPGAAEESVVKIGSGFVGMIDELRISRQFVTEPFLETFRQRTGIVQTRVFDLEYSNSRVLCIESSRHIPSNTSIRYFYRVSNELIGQNSLPAEWREFAPGSNLEFEAQGRYIQIMAELYPDGTGFLTPSISDMEIHYQPDLPPLPTSLLTADPGDRRIDLSWRPVIENDVAGYLLYYGYKPGNYFGTGLPAGDSPIDLGSATSIRLEGLENGRLYYFTVVTYDSSSPPHYSTFSKEISARPSTISGTAP